MKYLKTGCMTAEPREGHFFCPPAGPDGAS
jgi:hypothetical protein